MEFTLLWINASAKGVSVNVKFLKVMLTESFIKLINQKCCFRNPLEILRRPMENYSSFLG